MLVVGILGLGGDHGVGFFMRSVVGVFVVVEEVEVLRDGGFGVGGEFLPGFGGGEEEAVGEDAEGDGDDGDGEVAERVGPGGAEGKRVAGAVGAGVDVGGGFGAGFSAGAVGGGGGGEAVLFHFVDGHAAGDAGGARGRDDGIGRRGIFGGGWRWCSWGTCCGTGAL